MSVIWHSSPYSLHHAKLFSRLFILLESGGKVYQVPRSVMLLTLCPLSVCLADLFIFLYGWEFDQRGQGWEDLRISGLMVLMYFTHLYFQIWQRTLLNQLCLAYTYSSSCQTKSRWRWRTQVWCCLWIVRRGEISSVTGKGGEGSDNVRCLLGLHS